MSEPSNNIDPQLLPHLHLVVTRRHARPRGLDDIVNWLSGLPSIIQHHSTVEWRFLETPADGEVLLVCQSSQLGTHFASDGYVWASVEETMRKEVNGHILEIYSVKGGFIPEREPVTAHTRVRYRLRSQPHQPVDESLWLVLYNPAENLHRIPVRNIQITPQIRQTLRIRSELSRNKMGLLRKEFMRSDRDNWPRIGFPRPHTQFGQQPVIQQGMQYPMNLLDNTTRGQYPPHMMHQQQQQVMTGQLGVGPSPAKRPRPGTSMQAPASMTSIPGPTMGRGNLDDERSRPELPEIGVDYMDTLTPREISLARYVQHHDWLEEVLSSPYDTHQIIPPQLGIGRKGELESLTRDFFSAPTSPPLPVEGDASSEKASHDEPANKDDSIPRVGRLEGTKANDFTSKAKLRLAELNTEMENLKRQHAKRMSKFSTAQTYKAAEQQLRTTTLEILNSDIKAPVSDRAKALDELIASLERTEGKSIRPVKGIACLQKGGQEEALVAASREDGQDYEMSESLELDGVQIPTILPDPAQIAVYQDNVKASASVSGQQQDPSTEYRQAMQTSQDVAPSTENEASIVTNANSEGITPDGYVMVSKEAAIAPQISTPTDITIGADHLNTHTAPDVIQDTSIKDLHIAHGQDLGASEVDSTIIAGQDQSTSDQLIGVPSTGPQVEAAMESPSFQIQSPDIGGIEDS